MDIYLVNLWSKELDDEIEFYYLNPPATHGVVSTLDGYLSKDYKDSPIYGVCAEAIHKHGIPDIGPSLMRGQPWRAPDDNDDNSTGYTRIERIRVIEN